MTYTCKRCGYNANQISHLRSHLKKKKTCEPVFCNDAPGDILAELDTAEDRKKHLTVHVLSNTQSSIQDLTKVGSVDKDGLIRKLELELSQSRYEVETLKKQVNQLNSTIKSNSEKNAKPTIPVKRKKHPTKKAYRCHECDFCFVDLAALKIHMRTHSGERPFKCDQCEKAFTQFGNLKTHKRIHTGEKPYQCDQCSMAFGDGTHFKRHIVTYHTQAGQMRRKKQEERLCKALLAKDLTQYEGGDAHPPIGSFKREHRIDFQCVGDVDSSYARIDFVIAVEGGLIFLEVDEHQHKFGYDPSCDMKRMAKVHESLAVAECHIPIYWIRYNPNEYTADGCKANTSKAKREAHLLANVGRIDMVNAPPMRIEYMYYDSIGGVPNVTQAEAYIFKDMVCKSEYS